MSAAARRTYRTQAETAGWLDGLKLTEFVSLDLETTGLDSTTCMIIEIGAVRFQDGLEVAEFRTFVHIAGSLDPFITELTGITDADLADAPSIADSLRKLFDFIGTSPLVGQNVEFDIGFLRAAASTARLSSFEHAIERRYTIDTAMLARVFWPELPRFSLSSLCEFFVITQIQAHRAADDARVAGYVLIEMIRRLPGRVWHELSEKLHALIGTTTHRSCPFFASLRQLSADITRPEFAVEATYISENAVLDLNVSLNELLDKNGIFERRLPFFRTRSSQLEMAAETLTAFSAKQTLLVEAPTGVGKSLAYLVPALLWVSQDSDAGRQVIVSSHTKVLQEQLLRKDIEDIRTALDQPLRATVLKGRNNYLCKRRLNLLLKEADERLSDLDKIQLMPLLQWAEKTQTGDVSEINAFSPHHHPYLWAQVASDGLACAGSLCSAAKGDFHRKAQERATRAQVVFVNHALLLSDLTRFCGPEKRLVLDEAHQIERAVVAAMTSEISWPVLRGTLSRLADERSARGLLFTLQSRADTDTTELQTKVRALHIGARQAFAVLGEKLTALLPSSERTARLRYHVSDRLHKVIGEAFSELRAEWSMCAVHLLELQRDFGDRKGDERIPPDLMAEFRSVSDGFTALSTSLNRHLGEDNENEVRWIEFGQTSRGMWSSLFAAPISVGKVMQQSFWPSVENAVLTSATLSVGGDFSLTKETLGLNDDSAIEIRELTLNGPIDLAKQMRLFVPTYLPEPRVNDISHIESTVLLCRRLIERFARGTLILCTSNEQVEKITAAIAPLARRNNRAFFSQTIGHSLSELIVEFRRRKDAILVGASSLWEGIDVVGDSLQILVVTRLPFDVPTDPWISARCDALQNTGHDPFAEYSVPTVALRLRQGIGRLIRHPNDRGVAIIADPRLFLSRYGKYIRNTLPVTPQAMQSCDDLLCGIEEFFKESA